MKQSVTVDGVEYIKKSYKPGKRAVIVVDRGWIWAGDVTEKNGRIQLDRAVWVFRWESIGFAKMIQDPTSDKVDIRQLSEPVDIPEGSEIFRIPVDDDWGLND